MTTDPSGHPAPGVAGDSGTPQVLSPTGEPAAPHQVGLALRSLLAAAATGVGFSAGVLWLVRTLQVTGAAPTDPGATGLVPTLVFLSWLGGGALAALVAFALLAPLASAYRRGAFSLVAGLGTLPLEFLSQPVDGFLGRWGLAGLAVISGLMGLLLVRAILGSRT